MDLSYRFWAKVEKTETCWNWKATKNKQGYGRFWIKNKIYSAHRISYQLIKGEIPNGYEVDHLCKNTSCVNPKHLETVTPKENVRRSNVSIKAGLHQKSKTHCPRNHEYNKENTYINKRGHRYCRECSRIYDRIRCKSKNGIISAKLRTHCPQGHAYSGDNLYVNPNNNFRSCRTCVYNRNKNRRKSVIKQTL